MRPIQSKTFVYPIPDGCSDDMRRVIELNLVKKVPMSATAEQMGLTKGMVSRILQNYWKWRETGRLPKPQQSKPVSLRLPPAPENRRQAAKPEPVEEPALVEDDDPPEAEAQPEPQKPKAGYVVKATNRTHSNIGVRQRSRHPVEELLPPTPEEVFRSYYNQIVMASRGLNPGE